MGYLYTAVELHNGSEVKGKLANGIGSHYPSHCLEHGVSSITTANAHTSAASSRLNGRPRQFKWTRPFRRKTKSGFCACAITFQLASTYLTLTLSVTMDKTQKQNARKRAPTVRYSKT